MTNSNLDNSNCYNRKYSLEEQLLYNHLKNRVKEELPSQYIENFHSLLIEGSGDANPEVWEAIAQIVDRDFIEEEFNFILNRSCYIPINRWLQQPQFQGAIPELIDLFETIPTGLPSCWAQQRLRTLTKGFTRSEQYLALRRLAHMFRHKMGENTYIDAEKPLESLINRYPCLYEHCFLTDDSSDRERQEIRIIKNQSLQNYERDLSQFIARKQDKNGTKNELGKLKNPTLLSDEQVRIAIEHFTGKVDGIHSYQELAEKFRAFCRWVRSYRTFKEGLYEYLTVSIDPKYGRGQFSNKLYKYLQNTLRHNDSQKPSEFLFVGTCRKLLNFLVVESLQEPKHYVFYDLVNNLGSVFAIGILLKIVLFCRKVKPYLEQRFAILFNHYEGTAKNKVWWFVESLENLNLALTANFGGISLT